MPSPNITATLSKPVVPATIDNTYGVQFGGSAAGSAGSVKITVAIGTAADQVFNVPVASGDTPAAVAAKVIAAIAAGSPVDFTAVKGPAADDSEVAFAPAAGKAITKLTAEVTGTDTVAAVVGGGSGSGGASASTVSRNFNAAPAVPAHSEYVNLFSVKPIKVGGVIYAAGSYFQLATPAEAQDLITSGHLVDTPPGWGDALDNSAAVGTLAKAAEIVPSGILTLAPGQTFYTPATPFIATADRSVTFKPAASAVSGGHIAISGGSGAANMFAREGQFTIALTYKAKTYYVTIPVQKGASNEHIANDIVTAITDLNLAGLTATANTGTDPIQVTLTAATPADLESVTLGHGLSFVGTIMKDGTFIGYFKGNGFDVNMKFTLTATTVGGKDIVAVMHIPKGRTSAEQNIHDDMRNMARWAPNGTYPASLWDRVGYISFGPKDHDPAGSSAIASFKYTFVPE